ncbi:20294_t:CDS:2, partial [Dentiscutata erythropus]
MQSANENSKKQKYNYLNSDSSSKKSKRQHIAYSYKKALKSNLLILRHYLEQINIIYVNCKALIWIDERITTLSHSNPKFTTCCFNNKVQLSSLRNPPELLYSLLFGSDSHSKNFREMICAYNSALAFASIEAQIDKQVMGTKGVYVFKIYSEIYHNIGSLLLHNDNRPRFAQIYFYNMDNELQNRLHIMPQLDPTILNELQNMLYRVNPYVTIFKQMHDIWITNPILSLSIAIKFTQTNDPQQYNTPTANEMAVIM